MIIKRAFSVVSKMVNMEVSIISRDTIKPAASSSLGHQKPFKLSIIDQLTPKTYVPMVFFYPNTDHLNFTNSHQTLAQLKNSLSETLSLYYPLAGRAKNNLYIDDFDAGVPYLEAQVKGCDMFESLQLQETELLNKLVPLFHPLKKESDTGLPMIAIQVNLFACGGIAVGVFLSHKIFDGQTAKAFLTSWAAIFRGSHDKVVHPNLSQASLIFPPKDFVPHNYLVSMDRLWFRETNHYVTKRFLFDANAIAALQAKAKSERVPKPSRVEALTGFLWKHYAKAAATCSPKASMVAHVVNMRPRMKPQMSATVIGNLIWMATAADETAATRELGDLVYLMNESLKGFNSDYLETLQGEEGFGAISDFLNQLQVMFSQETIPEIYTFSSWARIHDQVDFGWGRPYWIGVMGKVGSPGIGNLTLFVETQLWGDGIEAWVSLDQNQMALLENDPHFLAFASPNQRIPTLQACNNHPLLH